MKGVWQGLKKLLRWAKRLLILGCIIYTVVTLGFDIRSNSHELVTNERCNPRTVEAQNEIDLERKLGEEFAPTLVFAQGEPTDFTTEFALPYQVVPSRDIEGEYVLRVGAAFEMDYGSSAWGFLYDGHTISPSKIVLRGIRSVLRVVGYVYSQGDGSHYRDAETMELHFRQREDGQWEFYKIVRWPHGNRTVDMASSIRCFRGSPLIYVSKGKHALYPSLAICNNSSVAEPEGIRFSSDICGTGILYYMDASEEFDVGDREHQNNIFATSPTLLENEVFTGEDVWAECFSGEVEDGKPCSARFDWW